MKYVIHARVSTDKQKTANQVRECLRYVETIKKPNDIVLIFEENETSSRLKIDKRPILKQALGALAKGDCLVIYKLDRLARNGKDLVNIYDDLSEGGVKIHSLLEPQADKSYVHIFAFVAMTEREATIKRTITGLRRKQQDMERVGAVWYGYQLDESKLSTYKDAKSEGKPYLLVPNPQEQEVLNVMKHYQSRLYSTREIAKKLKEMGLMCRSGKPFGHMSVYRILKREADRQNLVPAG